MDRIKPNPSPASLDVWRGDIIKGWLFTSNLLISVALLKYLQYDIFGAFTVLFRARFFGDFQNSLGLLESWKIARVSQSQEGNTMSYTHLEGMRKEPETRGSCPCRWGPPPLVWTRKVPSVTHTRSPLPGRSLNQARGSEGSCPASCPIWGIPRWKADLNFWLYIFWQMTGLARQFPCHQRLGPLVRSPPEQPRAVIPAQDSLRTTEVPYNQFSCRSLRCCFCFRVFPRGNPCCCPGSSDVAQLRGKLQFLRTDLPLLQWSATSSSLILPPAYQSVDVSTWLVWNSFS